MTDAAALRTLAGIGLRHPHLVELIERPPAGLAWVEVHTENYMAAGGPRLRQLELDPRALRALLPRRRPVARLGRRRPTRRTSPASRRWPTGSSRRCSRSTSPGASRTATTSTTCSRSPTPRRRWTVVAATSGSRRTCSAGGSWSRTLSSYLRFVDSTMPECVFVAELARRAGCGLLLDVNNIHVSAHNHGFDVGDYLAAMPGDAVRRVPPGRPRRGRGRRRAAPDRRPRQPGRPGGLATLFERGARRASAPARRWSSGTTPSRRSPCCWRSAPPAQGRLERAAGAPCPRCVSSRPASRAPSSTRRGRRPRRPDRRRRHRPGAPARRLPQQRPRLAAPRARGQLPGDAAPARPRALRGAGAGLHPRRAARPPAAPRLRRRLPGLPAARAGAEPPGSADLARLEWAREEAYSRRRRPAARPREPGRRSRPSATRSCASSPILPCAWSPRPARSSPCGRPLPPTPRPRPTPARSRPWSSAPTSMVTTRAIAAADLLLVQALADGLPLAEAAERAQAADPDSTFKRALALHLTGGTFRGLAVSG